MISPITVAIPTYNRGRILVETLDLLFSLEPAPDEILVVDQTADHDPEIISRLRSLDGARKIRWIRLTEPSIPKSMNRALRDAKSPLVLFLDDDLIPAKNLLDAHRRRYRDDSVWAVCGQVLTSDQKTVEKTAAMGTGFESDLRFAFNSTTPRFINNVMAGNLSVRRDRAIAAGGFDENFIGAAYRFETDFARRIWSAGGKVWFEPSARVVHLQAPEGGVRSFGHHLTTASPAHSAGDYYFALLHARGPALFRYVARRLLFSAVTRFHVRRPWFIIPKIRSEIRGFHLAIALKRQGRRLLHD